MHDPLTRNKRTYTRPDPTSSGFGEALGEKSTCHLAACGNVVKDINLLARFLLKVTFKKIVVAFMFTYDSLRYSVNRGTSLQIV